MFAPLSIPESVPYRLALIRPGSHTVLTHIDVESTSRLPCICIRHNTRVTASLHEALYATWGLRGLVLNYLPADAKGVHCAVIEILSKNVPNCLRATRVEEVHESDLSPDQRSSLLSHLSCQVDGPFSRLGWLREAIGWVEEVTGHRICSIEEIEQLNASPDFALLRIPVRDGQAYWLKATGTPNSHERAVTRLLSKLCPGHLPEILATKVEWNAWIMRDQGSRLPSPLDPMPRLKILKCAVSAMAEIQLQTIGHDKELLAAGAFDQRLEVLLADSEFLFEKIREAMSLQISTKVSRIEGRQLDELRASFDFACEHLLTLAIPSTVLHGDMNPGNVLWRDGSCHFIDWSETYWGHPLVTLQHLLLLGSTDPEQVTSSWDSVLIQRYQAVMRQALDSKVFEQAILCMPMIAAASALYSRGVWLRRPLAETLYRQARIRTLARHMDRAAQDPALRQLVRSNRASARRESGVATCCF